MRIAARSGNLGFAVVAAAISVGACYRSLGNRDEWSDVAELEVVADRDIRVGHELLFRLYYLPRRNGTCHLTQVYVTEPDGSVFDNNDRAAPQQGCTVGSAGQTQFIQQYFWTNRPGLRKLWPTLAGHYVVTMQFREWGPDGRERPGDPIVRTVAFDAFEERGTTDSVRGHAPAGTTRDALASLGGSPRSTLAWERGSGDTGLFGRVVQIRNSAAPRQVLVRIDPAEMLPDRTRMGTFASSVFWRAATLFG
jgi:hypothetical protein